MYKIKQKHSTSNDAVKLLHQAITPTQKLLYLHTCNDIITSVSLSINGQATIKQCSVQKTVSIKTSFVDFQKIDDEIALAFIEGGDGFLVYGRPFVIYFITKYQDKPIKLIFGQEILYESCVLNLNYPVIMIYGGKLDSKVKQVIEFNLETLGFKVVNDRKANMPEVRSEQFSMIMDGRLYIFGGKNEKAHNCDQLVWVYDIEKCVWFALQMVYPINQNFYLYQKIPISKSKVLVLSENVGKGWIFEIYQSRITEIEGQMELEGKYIFLKGELIRYSEDGWSLSNKEVIYEKK